MITLRNPKTGNDVTFIEDAGLIRAAVELYGEAQELHDDETMLIAWNIIQQKMEDYDG